jgi:hypothetical protein
VAEHTERDCDENCRCCVECYTRSGREVCDRLCPHRAENHPDEESED